MAILVSVSKGSIARSGAETILGIDKVLRSSVRKPSDSFGSTLDVRQVLKLD